MNYFDGINAIRDEQNAFYEQLIASQKEQKDLTSQVVQNVRTNLAKDIQQRYYCEASPVRRGGGATGRVRNQESHAKFSLKSKQHDEFAILNYYNQVSKYDLDRANLNMRKA